MQTQSSFPKAPPSVTITIGANPKICLLGNCHVKTYAVLLRSMLKIEPFGIMDLSEANHLEEASKAAFLEKCTAADLVLSMENHIVPSAQLAQLCPGSVIRIANLYFRGLFPDVCYLGTTDCRVEEPSPYQSVVMLDAFLQGKTPDECDRLFGPDNLARLRLLDAWESSIQEFRQRDSNTDVPAAGLIEEECLKYPAFLTINHPSINLVHSYLRLVFKWLGLDFKVADLDLIRDPLRDSDYLPIHDEYAEYLRLPYRISQRYKIHQLGGGFYDRKTMIVECYKKYAATPPDKFVVNSPQDLVEKLKADPSLHHLLGMKPNSALFATSPIDPDPSAMPIKAVRHGISSLWQRWMGSRKRRS